MDAFLFVDGYAAEFLRRKGIDPDDQARLLSLIEVDTEKKTLLAALKLVRQENISAKQDVLLELLSYGVPNIRILSLAKLATLLQGNGTLIYVENALQNPKFREKDNAVRQICKFGDERAVTAMIKRLRSILNTRKARPYLRQGRESELTDVIGYLDRYVEDPAVQKVFEQVLEKQDIFAEGEKEFIVSNYSYFAGLK